MGLQQVTIKYLNVFQIVECKLRKNKMFIYLKYLLLSNNNNALHNGYLYNLVSKGKQLLIHSRIYLLFDSFLNLRISFKNKLFVFILNLTETYRNKLFLTSF